MPLQPKRMTGTTLRSAARVVSTPLLGGAVRRATLKMYGLGALRSARLGDVPPYVVQGPGEIPPAGEGPGKKRRSRGAGR